MLCWLGFLYLLVLVSDGVCVISVWDNHCASSSEYGSILLAPSLDAISASVCLNLCRSDLSHGNVPDVVQLICFQLLTLFLLYLFGVEDDTLCVKPRTMHL